MYPERIKLVASLSAALVVGTIFSCSEREGKVSGIVPSPTPPGVPEGANWRYVEFVSEPMGARIEVNGNFIGETPCRAPTWVMGRGKALLNIVAYSHDGIMPAKSKSILVPPIPERVYFDMRQHIQVPVGASLPKLPTVAPRLQTNPNIVYSDWETDHWIDEVTGDGRIIRLEDSSLWEVDEVDTIITSIWLPTSDIYIRSVWVNGITLYELRNVEDDEIVAAMPLRRR